MGKAEVGELGVSPSTPSCSTPQKYNPKCIFYMQNLQEGVMWRKGFTDENGFEDH